MSDQRFDPRFDPAFQPGYTGPITETRSPARAAPAPAAPDPAPIAVASVPAPSVETEVDDPAPRRANPFLIVLGVVAVVLVGGGLYLASQLGPMYADMQSSSSVDYVTLQTLIFATPLAVALGVATGIGLLFVLVFRWDRR